MDHVLRLYERPLKQIVYIPLAIPFLAVGAAMMYSAVIRSTAPILGRAFMLALGGLSVAFFGVGSVVFLCLVGLRLLRPRPVIQIDAQGWAYTPTGRWTQRVAWQEIRRVALQRQPVKSMRRYLLVLEDERSGEPTPSEAHVQTATPAAPSDSVVLFVELNDLFLRITPEKALGLLERICTEFAVELARYGVTVANGIEDI